MRHVVLTCAAAAALLGGCAGAPTTSTTDNRSNSDTSSTTDTRSTTNSTTDNRSTATDPGQCGGLTMTDAWVKAADSGRTGGFGTLANAGPAAVTVVSVSSPASPTMELHETVLSATGAMQMQRREGGFSIAAGATLELRPGGSHVMFLALSAPLRSGTTTPMTLACADGSTLRVTAAVRTYAGAQETYAPGATTGSHGLPATSPAPAPTSHG